MKRRTVLLISILAAACSSAGPDQQSSSTATPSELESDQPGSSAATSLELEEVGRADAPISLVQRPGSDLLTVVERAGTIRLMDAGSGELGEPIIDIRDRTTTDSERGLLSAAYDTEGASLYLYYTDDVGDSVIAAWTVEDDNTLSERGELLTFSQPFANHNGGQVAIGPDGYLYIGVGDGGSGGDPLGSGQDSSTLLGSILRVDPTVVPYGIPETNPFVDGGGAPEVMFFGLRNPWRFSFDSETGDLWIADVGQNEVEEVNFVAAADLDDVARNFGWNVFEGSRRFSDGEVASHHLPLYEYDHAQGCSVTGGYVYHGSVSVLSGSYLFGDYCTSKVWALERTGDGVDFRDLGLEVESGTLGSFGQDLAGNVYVLSLDGPIYRIVQR